MKNLSLIVFILLCVLMASVNAQDLSKPRKWTSTAGSQIEASVLDIDPAKGVRLKTTNGRELTVAINLFVEADQAILRKALAAKSGTGAVSEAEAGKLPLFKDGPWKGYNTIFEGSLYDATLNSNGTLVLHPKVNGQRIGKTLQAYLRCHYREKDIGRWTHRPIVEFEEAPAPSHSKKGIKIELKGKFADDVSFEVVYDCDEDSISVHGSIKDPPRIKHPSIGRSRIYMMPTHKPGPEAKTEEIKAMMEGYSLSIRGEKGTETLPYWKSEKRRNNIRELRIKGPWDTKEIRLEASAVRNRETRETEYGVFWLYSNNAPYQGYYLFHECKSGGRTGSITAHFK